MESGLGESYASLTMFNCLPGAMLKERHTHECGQGHSCGRALLKHSAAFRQSHRLFNPAPPVARLKGGCSQDWLPHKILLRGER
jgi:hypothetical protein